MSRMKNEKGSGIRPGTFKRLMAYLFSHYRAHLITVIICIIITGSAFHLSFTVLVHYRSLGSI